MNRCKEWEKVSPRLVEIINQHLNEAPIKIGAMAKALGLKVKISSLKPNISGEIRPSIKNPNQYIIKVNRHETKTRQRFTIAHEIAHFILHKELIRDGISDDILYRSSQSNTIEAQANRFAADLIMPWNLLEEQLKLMENNQIEEILETLSRKFEISKIAMKIRLNIDN